MRIIRWIKVHLAELILATFLLPALVILIIFQLIPTIWTIWFSFTDMALIGKKLIHPSFIGLENYAKLLNDPIFWQSMKVTFEYCLASLVLRFVLGLLAALYLTSKTFKGKTIMAAVFLLPYIIPGVIHPYVWISMLDTRYGTLNRVLMLFGMPPQSWVYKRAMESVIMINSWAGYALAMLVLASAITSIPKEYYEVAEIYGASRWQRFTKITLPLIKYPVMLSMILIFKEDIDDFTYVYMFTEGGPHYRTELLSLYAYHKAFAYFELGYGCAVGFVIAILVFILTLAQLKLGGT
ncbi:MAG: hypothetical protein DRJ38_08405 [Thermoprotei archaeon]|nr:MAG: hypothetical protein DRJ38_08405 [Thermoprotei archaeon]